MTHRFVAPLSGLTVVVGIALFVTIPVAGQRPPRTPDGQPDLQGYWTNSTYTPLQRPKNVTKELYTPEEAADIEKRAAARDAARERLGIRPAGIDHPNGRWDAAQNNSLDDRCIITGHAGPPMLNAGYNATYQIVQAPGYVMILVENNHIVRLIPLEPRPNLPSNVRAWTGISRGRWAGNTLVVETTNLTTTLSIPGTAQPAFWNAGLYNTLAAARAEEKKTAEEAAKKSLR
jgi:hypothetical protein